MKKIIVVAVVAALAAWANADECVSIGGAGKVNESNTPYITKQERSPLGKEIDMLRRQAFLNNVAIYTAITNFEARIDRLEKEKAKVDELNRQREAKREEARKAAQERNDQRKALEAAKARVKGLKQNAAAKAAKAKTEAK